MSDGLDIDVAAVRAVAVGFTATSEAIATAAESLGRCAFGSSTCGRNYPDVGERIAAGYGVVSSLLLRWSAATENNVDRLRVSVDGYRYADDALSGSLWASSGSRIDGPAIVSPSSDGTGSEGPR